MDKKIKANILTKLGELKQNMTLMNKNLKREIIPAEKKIVKKDQVEIIDLKKNERRKKQ